jgi:hypothetical protein
MDTMDAKAEVLTSLARQMARQEPGGPLPLRLCRAATEILGVAGSAITVAYTSPDRVTLCATDDRAARLEDLQDVLGQGPGPWAYETRQQVHAIVDDPSEARWPEFSAAVQELLGRVGIHAFPMLLDHEILGVLTCHLPPDGLLLLPADGAQFLANAIGVALLRDPDSRRTAQDMPKGRSWSSRARIHQATGMVMAQLHISADDALVLLRAHAFAQDTNLGSISAAVVRRDLNFRLDDNDGRGQS